MGQHVLLIEDEPNIAEAIRFVLARDGWQVRRPDKAQEINLPTHPPARRPQCGKPFLH